jgi:dihydrofolate synthase/folylpolyglutamate synthase
MALLGDTIEKIAAEKAGIIKPQTPVIIGEKQERSAEVFLAKAKAEQSSIVFADEEFTLEDLRQEWKEGRLCLVANVLQRGKLLHADLICDLPGSYQRKNIPSVLAAIEELRRQGFEISEQNIRQGLSSVTTSTGLMGRWQVLSQQPLTIADTGHNEAGIREVLEQMRLLKYSKLHFVLGMVSDKDVSKVLELLPPDAIYYFCRANIPRAMDASELAEKAGLAGLNGTTFASVALAYEAARAAASPKDLVFVGGSTFTVAEVV